MYERCGHQLQLNAPGVDENVPGAHREQVVDELCSANQPAGQLWQSASDDAFEKRPGWHGADTPF